MLDRLQYTDGLGAIYPAMMYAIMAMDALGYERDHPDLELALRQFDDLILEGERSLIFQPCKFRCGIRRLRLLLWASKAKRCRGHAALCDWLLSKEIRRKGDWAAKRPDLKPSGWAFEFANEFYPDIDDHGHGAAGAATRQRQRSGAAVRAEERAVAWLLGMQSSDGGWRRLTWTTTRQFLNKVPLPTTTRCLIRLARTLRTLVESLVQARL